MVTDLTQGLSGALTAQQKRAQLDQLMNSALDAVVTMDEDGTILEWNPKAEEIFGWTQEEAVGAHLGDLIVVPRYRESHEKWLHRFRTTDRDDPINERQRLFGLRRDGTEVPTEATIWGLPTNPVTKKRVCSAVIRDLTEAEEATRTQARLAAIVNSSQDAIVGRDLDGIITTWNGTAERLYGYTAEEAIGQHFAMIVPPHRRPVLEETMKMVARGEALEAYDTERLLKSGELLDVSVTVSPIFGPDGSLLGASSTARDISERKRLERENGILLQELESRVEARTAELEEANRALEALVASKTEFVASVSHELRTPLTSVIGFAELLRDTTFDLDDPNRYELLDAIADQGYELANIVEDLLVAARVEIGELSINCVPVNMKAQAAQVLESMRDRDTDNISVTGEAPTASADPQRVRQILRNLLTNAIRYGGPNVTVEVGRLESGDAFANVSDDGDGVPDADVKTIFQPYKRAHKRPGMTESFGLGLAISRDLARLMGGDLTYEKDGHPTFTLVLPAKTDTPAV
jgi:PAS domain S-box-containing protein